MANEDEEDEFGRRELIDKKNKKFSYPFIDQKRLRKT